MQFGDAPQRSNYALQASGTAYPNNIDSDSVAVLRLGARFAPRQLPTAAMRMAVDPGWLAPAGTPTEVGTWNKGSVTSGSATISNLDTTAGISQGSLVIAWTYVSGALVELFPSGTYVKTITAANPGAGSVTVSANATTTSTTQANNVIIFCQGVGCVANGNSHTTTTLDGFDTNVLNNVFVGMAVTGGDAPVNATVATINRGAGSLTLSGAATGTHTGLAYTFTVPVPAANPRIDRVTANKATGAVTWTKGSEAATPSAPAVPSTDFAVAQLYTTTGTTALTKQSNILIETSPTIQSLFATQTSLTSSATTDLGSINTQNVLISGTTTITSFGSSASASSPIFLIEFSGALTLTHNGTSFKLPGSANIVTAAGDTAVAEYLGSGNWRVREYSPVDGQPVSNTLTGPITVGPPASGVALTVDAVSGTHPLKTQDSAANAALNVGYLEVPIVGGAAKTTSYTAVLADSGKLILMNASTLTATIPANSSVAYPLGAVLTFVNTFAGNLSIAITTDTMTLVNSTLTGPRTLAQNGMATAVKVGTTSWIISGSGLS